MKRFMLLGMGLVLLCLPALASAQGVLIVVDPNQHVRLPRPIWPPHPWPRPVPPPIPEPQPVSYKIKELAVQAKLVDQVARVQVSQSFVNTGSRQMEVSFVFPLPYDGAIDQLTLLVDGKEFPAKLLPATEARQVYESIVRKNRDPALLEWIGTGMFQTSVFPVPPGAERKVTLRYSQLCRKDHNLTDFLFPLSTAKYTSQPVEKVDIQVSIESKVNIKSVYSPTYPIEVKRPDARHAMVSYTGRDQVPSSDFRLLFDVEKGKVGASVVSFRPNENEDGFFLLLASPEIKASDAERVKKTVLFVIDRSGSMSGKKIEQVKAALKFVLNNLREGDLFNIVAYDSSVESFRPELEKFNDETRKQAIGFVEGIYAGGGTNIDGALTTALDQLKDSSRPNFVVFLTDGLPTVGKTNEAEIIADAKSHNQVRARLVSFGVGYDVNARLLDRLSQVNRGQTEYVRPEEDIEAQVSRLYSKISSPVMTDVAAKFEFDQVRAEEGQPINRLFPKESFDLFEGEQLVLVGRYRKAGPVKVTITGNVSGQQQKFDFPAELVGRSGDESYGFVEKLWAMRRIGDIIDEMDLKGKNDELVKELVALSTKHGILTPYTSFLADDTMNVRELTQNETRARRSLEALSESGGISGFAQRAEKARFKSADGLYAPAMSAPADSFAPATPAGRLAGEAKPGGGGMGGGMGGRGMAGGSFNYGASAGSTYRDLKEDKEVAAENLRNVGNKSFYRRASDRRWVDSTVTAEMEKKAIRVVQFSEEYFRLAKQNGRKLSQYLVFDEPMLVNLNGQAYQIDPAEKGSKE
ncbi:MAG: VIT domain-containing protein [Pirellulales bacterium]